MKLKTISAIIFVGLLAYGVWWLVNLIWLRPNDIDLFFYRSFMELNGDRPEALAEADVAVMDAIQPFNYSFSDPGGGRERARQEAYLRISDQLGEYDIRVQEPQQQLTYQLLEFELDKAMAAKPFFYHEYLFYPGGGAHQQIIDYLAHTYPIRDRDEAEAYYEDIKALPNHIKALTNNMKERVRREMLPPKHVMQASIDEIVRFLADPPSKNILYLSFARRAIRVNPTQLNEGEAVEWMDKIEWAMSTKVYPAYKSLLSYLQSVVESCPTDIGIDHLPEGKAYYDYRLKWIAETQLTPGELMELGKAEIENLRQMVRSEGNAIRKPLGDSLGAYFEQIPPSTITSYTDDQKGIDLLLNDYRKIINDVRIKITGAIEQEPQNKLIQVTFLDTFAFPTSPQAIYYPLSLGAKEQYGQPVFVQRKSKLIFKLKDLQQFPNWPMRTQTYFYTYPGRHLQLSLQRENEELPYLRRTADLPAFGQGWALYATTLADELGFHKDPNSSLPRDTYSRLGYIQMQLLYASFLVVDPGIHSEAWTREQAIRFIQDHTGFSEANVAYWVDQIIAEPGTHIAPYLGQKAIGEARDAAQKRLGSAYSVQDFHARLLGNGSLPLEIMRTAIDGWQAEYIA